MLRTGTRNRAALAVVGAIVVLMTAACAVSAGTVNLVGNFPTPGLSNGLTANAYSDSGVYESLTYNAGVGNLWWYPSDPNGWNWPCIRTSELLVGRGESTTANYITMFGWQSKWPVFSFLAPSTGTYYLNGSFGDGRTDEVYSDAQVAVYQDGEAPLWSTRIWQQNQTQSFSVPVVLNAGDHIRFSMWPNNPTDAFIKLQGTITTPQTVPEPASLLILGMGLLGVIRRRK